MKQLIVLLLVVCMGACGAGEDVKPEGTNTSIEKTEGHDHGDKSHADHGEKGHDAHGHDHGAHGDKAHADHGAHGHDAHGHDHGAHGDKAHANTAHGAAGDKPCDHGKEGAACDEAKEGGTCSCPAIKEGTGWCDHCSAGYVEGEKTKDKTKVDAATNN